MLLLYQSVAGCILSSALYHTSSTVDLILPRLVNPTKILAISNRSIYHLFRLQHCSRPYVLTIMRSLNLPCLLHDPFPREFQAYTCANGSFMRERETAISTILPKFPTRNLLSHTLSSLYLWKWSIPYQLFAFLSMKSCSSIFITA